MSRSNSSLTRAWFDLARQSIDLMQGSTVVIGKRSTAMMTAGANPTAAHDREMRRMVEEKVHASSDSIMRMTFAAATAGQSMWLASMLGGRMPGPAQWQRVTTDVLAAGMAPYRKTVRSNVKRLRK